MTVTPGSIPHWTATVASRDAYDLAEGPVWDAPRDRVVWVDIDAGRIHEGRLIGDQIRLERTHAHAESCGAVAISETGDMVVAGRLGTVVLTADGATQDIAPELLAANPDAGKLFVAHVGQRGLPETPWAGRG